MAFPRKPETSPRVEGNARLTAGVAVLLFVLLAAEGVTILQITALLKWHVAIGAILIPPVLVKTASTTWRFLGYYRGDPDYVQKGPPPLLLRLLGPFVVVLTFVLFGSGVALLFHVLPHGKLLLVHKASFLLWLGATGIHVLGHLGETVKIAPADWRRRSRRAVPGAAQRQVLLVASLALGGVTALFLVSRLTHYVVVGH